MLSTRYCRGTRAPTATKRLSADLTSAWPDDTRSAFGRRDASVGHETFLVSLSSPSNSTVATGKAPHVTTIPAPPTPTTGELVWVEDNCGRTAPRHESWYWPVSTSYPPLLRFFAHQSSYPRATPSLLHGGDGANALTPLGRCCSPSLRDRRPADRDLLQGTTARGGTTAYWARSRPATSRPDTGASTWPFAGDGPLVSWKCRP